MEEGTVERWLKAEGDPVKAGEPLLEITTDKLTNEVAAETDGVLLKIVAQEGADVPVKGLLGYIGRPGEQVGVLSLIYILARARSAKSLALADRASRLRRSASRITGTMSPASRATAMPRFTWARRMICSPSKLTRISG